MITRDWCRMMAAYNAEMNRRLYAGADRLTDAQRWEERGAFFGYEGANEVAVRDGDRATNLKQTVTGDDFFGVLGARPALGRTLVPADDQFGAAVGTEGHQALGADPVRT